MPPSPWSRIGSSGSQTPTTKSSKRVAAQKRNSNTKIDYDDAASTIQAETTLPLPALKEAREQSKHNLQLAWEDIFARYSSGNHLAAGRDDVFDFGTGEVVEDAGFLDDFVVESDDEVFNGRSIEIGDFGLPGAIGMDELTDSSSEEEDHPTTPQQRPSMKSESYMEEEGGESSMHAEGSGDEMNLASTPGGAANRRQRNSIKREANNKALSRSLSLPDSVDLLSSSDDELGLWEGSKNVAPVSEKYKQLKYVRTVMKEDLKEFVEAEGARQAREELERVKRERTCTPFLGSSTAFQRMRSQSIRPPPRSAPSSFRSSTQTARYASVSPSKPPVQPTASTSSLHYSIKRESSVLPIDIKPPRHTSSRPHSGSFSQASSKPSSSSSSSLISASYATSAIPLGHYSNTLLSQAIACDDDSSEDEFLIQSPIKHVKREIDTPSRISWSAKGKGRAKEEDVDNDPFRTNYSATHLPSPPPSRPQSRKKRSPSFYASSTQSTLTLAKARTPVVEIAVQRNTPIPHSRPPQIHPHSVQSASTSHNHLYRPKQSSPLKGSSDHLHRSHSTGIQRKAAPICISSDEDDDDVPLQQWEPGSLAQYERSSGQRGPTSSIEPRSPNKRKISFSPEMEESPTRRARNIFPTPPRSFSASDTRDDKRRSTATPATSFAGLSLKSIPKKAVASPRRNVLAEDVSDATCSPIESKAKKPSPGTAQIQQRQVRPVHLPTPPRSSDSASTSSLQYQQATPPEAEREYFKIPSPPKRTVPSPKTTSIHNTPSMSKKRIVKPETPSSGSDDDEILLVSPARPANMRTNRSTPSPLGKGFLRSDSRVRSSSSVQRNFHTSVKREVQTTQGNGIGSPSDDEDGNESDDPLGI